jgi:hypothetical protein
VRHIKIYLPCNFEVNPITHFGVISLFSLNFHNFNTFRPLFLELYNLYSSNLGTFWLKIEQFWSFEEISIFSNGGHLGYRTALTDIILKGDHLRIISAKFGWDWFDSFRGEDFFFRFFFNNFSMNTYCIFVNC